MSPQNIYDNPAFFAGYSQIPRSVEGLDAVYEWPAFQRLLPPSLVDCRILDLGCGLGYFAREARFRGARSVVGVDISERMLADARSRSDDAGISYVRSSLEAFEPEADGFDLVVSMLALHYMDDYAGVLRRVARCLVPGGRFAFSVEHPIYTANGTSDWHHGPDGTQEHWPVDHYRDEGMTTDKVVRRWCDQVSPDDRDLCEYAAGCRPPAVSPGRTGGGEQAVAGKTP